MFQTTILAARAGFTWSERLIAFVRFLPRSDGGYDVEVVPDLLIVGSADLRFARQYPAVRLDPLTLDRLVSESAALREMAPPSDWVRLVIDRDGNRVEAEHERRIVGL